MPVTIILLGICILLAMIYLSFNQLKKVNFLYWNSSTKLDLIEEKYDRLRSSLSDLKVIQIINYLQYHYYWAQSNNEKDKLLMME